MSTQRPHDYGEGRKRRKSPDGHGFQEGTGGDTGLPPEFNGGLRHPREYRGFASLPLFDPGKGHYTQLVPDQLRIGLFRILSDEDLRKTPEKKWEEDDYLRCFGYDPSTGKTERVRVAKPRLLQRERFDKTILVLRDTIVTFDHKFKINEGEEDEKEIEEVGLRKASGFFGAKKLIEQFGLTRGVYDLEDEEQQKKVEEIRQLIREAGKEPEEDEDRHPLAHQYYEEFQRITEDYYPGDQIVAIRATARKDIDSTGWTPDDITLSWVDLNFSGRSWAVTFESFRQLESVNE